MPSWVGRLCGHYMILVHFNVKVVILVTVVPAVLRSSRSGLFLHFSHHQVYSTWGDLAGSSRPREIDSQLVLLLFSYYRPNSRLLLAQLLANRLVSHSNLVQVYNFVPDVLRQFFRYAHCGVIKFWFIGGFCELVFFI